MLRAWRERYLSAGTLLVALLFLACRPGSSESPSIREGGPTSSTADAGAIVDAAAPRHPWGDAGTRFESGFAGTRDRTPFRAQLVKDGGALSGFSRYANRSADFSLAGDVADDGTFSLVEKAPDGGITGRFAGTFTSPRAASGVWSSPDGSRSLPFLLKAAGSLPRTRGPLSFEDSTQSQDAGFGCTNIMSWPLVSGLVPESRNRALDALFEKLAIAAKGEDVHCTGTERRLPWSSEGAVVVESQAPPFLALVASGAGHRGGAHPRMEVSCVLVDAETAKEVRLADLLGSAAMAALSADFGSQLAKFRRDNGLEHFDRQADVASHLCYVSPEEIDIRFNPYEIGPHALGSPQFEIDARPLVRLVPAGRARLALFGQ